MQKTGEGVALGNDVQDLPKLSRSITLAAKAGGPDPESNAPLRVAIQNGKAANLSKENIENAIKRASGSDASDITEVTYEAKGTHGALFYIECATDKHQPFRRQPQDHPRQKRWRNRPQRRTQFHVSPQDGDRVPGPGGKDLDELEFELIDAGLEELSVDDGVVSLIGDYTSFNSLNSAVEGMGIETTKSGLQRLPTQPIELTESQIEDVEALLDKIEDDDDVQAVYTNLN